MDGKVTMVRNKAKLAILGFNQVEELNYDEIYASITHLEFIWMLLVFVAHKSFKLYQMNVKSILLN